MDQKRELSRLDLHSFKVGLASLAIILFGVVCLLLYLNPTIIGLPANDGVAYRGNFIWLCTGLLFLITGMAFFLIAGWWSRRLRWIIQSQKARPMQLTLDIKEDSDSTSYYALLHYSEETSDKNKWRATIWLKPGSAKDDIGKPFDAQVYFDPGSGKPAIIEYEKGILWVMAGSGSVLRLS